VIDRSPTRLASVLATVVALGGVVVTGVYSWLALALGGVGFLVLTAGVLVGNRAGVTTGAAVLFLGVLGAGFDGAPALVALVGTVAAILAWDCATTAISLGRQLGRDAPTGRLELVGAATTAAIGTGAAAVTYGLFVLVEGGESLTALVFLVLAVVLIASALR